MNEFDKWLDFYKRRHGPVLDLALMEASLAVWNEYVENKDNQMTTPQPHIHQKEIIEWAADPTWPWQFDTGLGRGWETIIDNKSPEWNESTKYRRKPRWYDMEQDWIAKGKPPVEIISMGMWRDCNTILWADNCEYRFKDLSRHAALKAEWEAKGRPARQYIDPNGWMEDWEDITENLDGWFDVYEYRIKPTPHPDAAVLRALAEDGSLVIDVELSGGAWYPSPSINGRLRISPKQGK